MTPEIRAILNGVMSAAWKDSVDGAARVLEEIGKESEDPRSSDRARSNCRFVLENIAFVRAAIRRVSLRQMKFTAQDGVDYVIRRVSGAKEALPHSASAASAFA